VIATVPDTTAVGVKLTVQFADPVRPVASKQLSEGPKDPEPSDAKETVPVGVLGLFETSLTVAVHDVVWPTTTVEGVHDNATLDACTILIVRLKLLVAEMWPKSPR